MSEHPLVRFKKYAPWGVGVVVGLFGFFVIPGGLIFPPLMALVAWAVTKVILYPKPGSPTLRRIGPGSEAPKALGAGGVDQGDLEKTLREAQGRQREIENAAFRVTKPAVRQTVDGIAQATARIIDEVRRDPKDLRNAYQFFGYYLDAALKIIKRYVDMVNQPSQNPDEQAAIARVEGELDGIRAAFEKQLALLRENDMIDLDVELTVLKKTIEMEGLAAERRPGDGKEA